MDRAVELKPGFTTGTAAAAATKAALSSIVTGICPSTVDILLLTGEWITIPVHMNKRLSDTKASAIIIKDAGDDPDVTHKAEIGVTVTLCQSRDVGTPENHENQRLKANRNVHITAGEGVGWATLPGLEIEPGEPAINPGPRKMIIQAVQDILGEKKNDLEVFVEIFVPKGRLIAEKTLNARLGIIGGISILGTTGIVRPMSHESYEATIVSAMSVARAGGCNQIVLATGRRSERFSQSVLRELPEIAFIQIGDFFKMSLEAAFKIGFEKISLAVLFGKAVKMAQGFPHTHAAKSDLSLSRLSEWAMDLTFDSNFSRRISLTNTARAALGIITETYPDLIADVGKRMIESARYFGGNNAELNGIIFDYTGSVIYHGGS